MGTSQSAYRTQLRITTPEEVRRGRVETVVGYTMLWLGPVAAMTVLVMFSLR